MGGFMKKDKKKVLGNEYVTIKLFMAVFREALDLVKLRERLQDLKKKKGILGLLKFFNSMS